MPLFETLLPILIGVVIHGMARSINPDGTVEIPNLSNKPKPIHLGFIGPFTKALQGSVIIIGVSFRIPDLVSGISPENRTFFFLIALSAGYLLTIKIAFGGFHKLIKQYKRIFMRMGQAALNPEINENESHYDPISPDSSLKGDGQDGEHGVDHKRGLGGEFLPELHWEPFGNDQRNNSTTLQNSEVLKQRKTTSLN